MLLTLLGQAYAQIPLNSSDILQTVNQETCYFYELKKYPTARAMYEASVNNTAMPKKLKKGERYRVIGMAEEDRLWGTCLKVRLEKKGKEGWILTTKLADRTALIPFFPDFREEYLPNVKARTLSPGMNADEVFLATNVHFTKEKSKPCPLNPDYTQWGEDGKCLIFHNDSLVANSFWGNSVFYYKPSYTLELLQVETNQPVSSQNIKGSSYWDENIEINWALGIHTLNFAVKNLSLQSVKLLWDDMVYINDRSMRVIHNGVRLDDRNSAQAGYVVARETSYSDGLMPSSWVEYKEGRGWISRPIIKNDGLSADDEKAKEKVVGQTLKILFAFQKGDEKYEYTFTLRVSGVNYSLEKGRLEDILVLSSTE